MAESPSAIVIAWDCSIHTIFQPVSVHFKNLVQESSYDEIINLRPTISPKMCNTKHKSLSIRNEAESYARIIARCVDGIAIDSEVVRGIVEVGAGCAEALGCDGWGVHNAKFPAGRG